MYSVGILAQGQKWPDVLRGMAEASGSSVSGWINPLSSPPEAMDKLIDQSDLIWIPEKINGGMDEAINVIRRSRHLSLGFPVSDFTDQAECLVKLAQEARVQVQVGHSERHRLVFRSSLAHISHPQHIRLTHHLPEFQAEDNPQGIFHEILADLDLVLGLTGSQSKKVRTHAAFLASGKLFQIDTRIEFHNGSVISLAVRQGTGQAVREIEVLQETGLVFIDLARGCSSIKNPGSDGWTVSQLWPAAESAGPLTTVEFEKDEATARQCINFIHALQMGKRPLSDLEEGYAALEITRQIESSVGRF